MCRSTPPIHGRKPGPAIKTRISDYVMGNASNSGSASDEPAPEEVLVAGP